ncbi:hypothetical protein BH24ACT5_BH24ACT5_01010 [soil metagenome]
MDSRTGQQTRLAAFSTRATGVASWSPRHTASPVAHLLAYGVRRH